MIISVFSEYISGLFTSTWLTIIDYVSFHVLLCLIPAFFIAGAMIVFVPTDSIMKYLGPDTKKVISYPVAAIAGLLLAVCSCTVMPLFIGIYKKGAGLGPAITFLFAAPAVNILALTYTGTLIGMDIAIARAVLAIGFAILIGIIMNKIFPTKTENKLEAVRLKEELDSIELNFINFIKASLVIINLFSGIILVLVEVELILYAAFIAGVLSLLILTRLEFNRSTGLFLWLVFALFVGTSRIEPYIKVFYLGKLPISPSLSNMVVKIVLVAIVTIIIKVYTKKYLDNDDVKEWMRETYEFFKSIFPLILVGVTLAGAIKYIVPQDYILTLVGSNTVLANFIAVFFGIFMYFPTLMEVPIARTFLDLGMARGPLLAYLLADPELSIQSILVTRKYLGDKKNLVYVLLVAIFTTLAGLIFGFFVKEGIGWI